MIIQLELTIVMQPFLMRGVTPVCGFNAEDGKTLEWKSKVLCAISAARSPPTTDRQHLPFRHQHASRSLGAHHAVPCRPW